MDYLALKALDAAHTAELPPDEAAAALSAMTRTERRLVPLWQVKKALVEAGSWHAIVAGKQSETPAIAALCIDIVSYMDDQRFEHIDMDLQSTKGMLGGAMVAGLVTEALAAELDGMADAEVPLIADCGFATLGPHHVELARSM